MTFVHPKSLQNDLKRLQNAYSTSSSHASTVLLVLHDHLSKMLIAAPLGFFAYLWEDKIFLRGEGRLTTKISITFFVGIEILNIFHLINFRKKTIFSKITAKNNFFVALDDKNEYNFFCGKWGTE